MENQPAQNNHVVIDGTKVIGVVASFHAFFLIIFGLFFTLGGFLPLILNIQSLSLDKETTAVVAQVSQHRNSDGDLRCTANFSYKIGEHSYIGESNKCGLVKSQQIKVKYNSNNPEKSSFASESFEGFIIGVLFSIIGVAIMIVGIVILASKRKRSLNSDEDGDGLMNDNKPATEEQKILIETGFRDLGVFHQMSASITQAEAREIIKNLEAQQKTRKEL